MAPKRKQTNPPAAAAADRVIRRSTRLAKATVTPPAADQEPPKKKKTTATAAAADQEDEAKVSPPPAVKEAALKPDAVKGSKTIIIEHCKQCNSFKTRALQVKSELEKDVAGVKVVVNPEKPRKGCFEIREEGGDIFVSLLDMKRPFPPLKQLDMGALISDIVDKIR